MERQDCQQLKFLDFLRSHSKSLEVYLAFKDDSPDEISEARDFITHRQNIEKLLQTRC